jgi:hypothetical protein
MTVNTSLASKKPLDAAVAESDMHGRDEKDMLAALGSMARTSVDRCFGNKVEARERMKEWLAYDRRFEGYDPDRLVDRVMLSRSNGAVVELDDPALMRGGTRRPLDRSGW